MGSDGWVKCPGEKNLGCKIWLQHLWFCHVIWLSVSSSSARGLFWPFLSPTILSSLCWATTHRLWHSAVCGKLTPTTRAGRRATRHCLCCICKLRDVENTKPALSPPLGQKKMCQSNLRSNTYRSIIQWPLISWDIYLNLRFECVTSVFSMKGIVYWNGLGLPLGSLS